MEWGQAKIEFLALRDEIQTALANGKTAKRIHAELKSQNRITMSQRSFYDWLRRERSAQSSGMTKLPVPANPANRQSPSKLPAPSSDQKQTSAVTTQTARDPIEGLFAMEKRSFDDAWDGEFSDLPSPLSKQEDEQ
jgi:site-specific recombinase XerD